MTAIQPGWDIRDITPAQWSKLLASASGKEGSTLCWNGKNITSIPNEASIPQGFQRIPISKMFSITDDILIKGKGTLHENSLIGAPLLKQLRVLLSGEEERIKNISASKLQGQDKELDLAKRTLLQVESLQNPSTKPGTLHIMKMLQEDRLAMIQRWIVYGGMINKPLQTGNTALTQMLLLKKPNEMLKLLVNESDVFLKNKDGRSAFGLVLTQPDLYGQPFREMFLNKFKNVSRENRPALIKNLGEEFSALLSKLDLKDETKVNSFLELLNIFSKVGLDINAIQKDGLSFLALAIQQENSRLVELLIKMGADHKLALKQLGMSKLMFAAWKGDLEAVKRILTERTKTLLGNAKDKEGNTALIWALRMRRKSVVEYLVKEMGVALNAKNKQGHRAISYAKSKDMADLLWEKGATNDDGKNFFLVEVGHGLVKLSDIAAKPLSILNAKDDSGCTALHSAALAGRVDLIEELVKCGVSINAVNKHGKTPLMLAAYYGKIDAVKKLMELGANLNVKDFEGNRAYNPNLMKRDENHRNIQLMLLNAGAKDKFGKNGLMREIVSLANKPIEKRDYSKIDALISSKWDLNTESDEGFTALSYAMNAAIASKDFTMVEKLLNAGASITTSSELGDPLEILLSLPLETLPKSELVEKFKNMAEMLFKYGAKLRSSSELMYTIWKGDLEGAAKLIQIPGVNINAINVRGATAITMSLNNSKMLDQLIKAGADVNLGAPLVDAILRLQNNAALQLLTAGAKVNIRGKDGLTPLCAAMIRYEQGKTDLLPVLIEKGADPNAVDSEGNTVLHYWLILAAKMGLILAAKMGLGFQPQLLIDYLQKHTKMNFNAQNDYGTTPLHLAIDLFDDLGPDSALPVFEALIPLTNMALRDSSGETPFIAAIQANDGDIHENVIPLFLEATINADLKDAEGNSPLYHAVHSGDTNLVDMLIDYEVDLDAENNSEMTVVESLREEIEDLQNQEEVDEEDEEKIKDYEAMIQRLLDAGARDARGHTGLMRAIFDQDEKNGYERVQIWISKGADVNARDYSGLTPAMLAVLSGKTKILELLIKSGADVYLRCDRSATALHYAIVNKNVAAVKLLAPLPEKIIKALMGLNINDMQEVEEFAVHLHATLSPSEYMDALILPHLIKMPPLSRFMLKQLTPEEQQTGLEKMEKIAGVDVSWYLDYKFAAGQRIFKLIEAAIPVPTKAVDLDSLLRMFDKINTLFPKKPGYLDPQKLRDDGTPKSLKEIRKSLGLLVKRVKNKNEAFLATPEKGTPELVKFYTKIENALAYIIDKISDPACDPDVRTSVLFDLAIAGSHCGARYKSETTDWYRSLSQGIETLTFPEEIEKILQRSRIGAVETMTKRMIYSDGYRVKVPNRPHIYNQIVRTIGKKVGIPNVAETYNDTAFWLKYLTEPILISKFAALYNIKSVIDRIDAAINGTIDDHGNRIPASREIHPLIVNAWLKESMPADWKLQEALEFTRYDDGGEGQVLNYQTYIQAANKEYDGELKRLKGMSEAEIVKESNPKIKDHLFKQYRIKLGDDIDPQNWEQVKASIEAQMKELKGGYRGLLEQPGKLDEIRDYIKQNFIGRENYTRYAIEVVLGKFGIVAPNKWQDWGTVMQAIENMRVEEYANTTYRDKNGVIPRDKIREMLVKMGVLANSP